MSYIATASIPATDPAAAVSRADLALGAGLPLGEDGDIALPQLERSVRLLGQTRASVSVFRVSLEGPGALGVAETLGDLLGERVLVDRLPAGNLVLHAPHIGRAGDAEALRDEIDAALRMALFRTGARLHARARVSEIHRDASILGDALDLVAELFGRETRTL